MKELIILVPNGNENNLSSIVGAFKIMSRANSFWKSRFKQDRFRIRLAGITKKVNYSDALFSVQPHCNISAVSSANLIIIPSLNHDYRNALKKNAAILPWLRNQYKQGAEIASICTGAFLLAASGLIDGKSCSTHWFAADEFRSMFPHVKLEADQLITQQNGIYTNGGAYSFLNLLIYLVEKYFDRETAIFCAKVFQIDMDRKSQAEFSLFNGQKMHGDELIVEAQRQLESNLKDKISIEALSSSLAVGRRNFDRRFIKATGNTPLEYAQRVKVEAAKKAFENSRLTISEVMHQVGYNDDKAFREVFKRYTGMSPISYKARYNKDAAIA